jgi:nitrate reductase (cytochrome), electron transfer subunit
MDRGFARNKWPWIAAVLVAALIALVFAFGWMIGRRAGETNARPPVAKVPAERAIGRSDARQLDPFRRSVPVDQEATPVTLARVQNVDLTRERAYPMQPPTIPHAIDGYQVNKNTNRCMLCHARANAERFQAPPVSVTHYMDRDDQFLAAISPRRYFCSQCHAVQTDAPLLVENTFADIDALLAAAEAETEAAR